ncbi:spherulation-specific family 4 protein [Propioniciclava soli]|uniref:spherulation-specific family 4 protein n=1 Tax=Propioniciclava soli TaxID=2775081 RepID=UPI001E594EE7|nr:spherulation-specific family 4 protein [Propioniciclava soli]
MVTLTPDGPQLAAPFYLHPAEHPTAWEFLRQGPLGLAFAVVNVASGPGPEGDPYYTEALRPGIRTPLLGYVNTGYGQRDADAVRRDAATWRERYGVSGVMLDCVSTDAPSTTLELIGALRADGATKVALNPGAPCAPEVVAAADVTCVSECAWSTYAGLAWPDRPAAGPTWHLVHGVPLADITAARDVAARRGAAFVWVTDATLPNPYARLPEAWP